MKRGEPPKRKTPLKRGKPPKRAQLSTARRTRNRRAVDASADLFSAAVLGRAHGRCEARVSVKCTGRATEAHHVVTRQRGRGWPWLHDPSRNGLACCAECHIPWIHANPDRATELCMLASRPLTDDDPGLILPRIAEARRATVDKC